MAEPVTEGHPDKRCDLIADSILDACLKEDPESRVACEVLATKGNIIVAGEITGRYEPSVFGIAKKVLEGVGYSAEGIEMDALTHQQSPDIAGVVSGSKEKRSGVSANQEEFSSGYDYEGELDDEYGLPLDGEEYFHGSEAIREKVTSAVVSARHIDGILYPTPEVPVAPPYLFSCHGK